jgi:sigma-B regulation protein RsbU (phosphoserine phosphatase)
MLVRNGRTRIERLHEGGPVLGLLPAATYSAAAVEIEASDMLILYSDGINEATNQNDEQFGEDRIKELISDTADAAAAEVCGRIMDEAFVSAGAPPDDRTLVVVKFPQSVAASRQCKPEDIDVPAVA